MGGLRRLYRWLVRRVPPRVAWALWRTALLVARRRRGRVDGPPIASARLAWGATEAELAGLVARMTDSAEADATRLLVITDCAAVHVAAARGVRLEHVPPLVEWRRRFPNGDYDAFLERRMRSILASYRVASLEVSPAAPASLVRATSAAGIRPRSSG